MLAKPPEKARLLVEIWAEAGRNPRVAAMIAAIDAEVRRAPRSNSSIRRKRLKRACVPGSTPVSAPEFFLTFVAGIFKRIAIEDDFDPEAEMAMAVGVLKALLAGALSPDLAPPLAQAP